MSLATRCPICEALFRVTPDQLRVRAGQVRCGRCNAVFDGLAHIVPDSDRTASAAEKLPADAPDGPLTEFESLDFVVDSHPAGQPATGEPPADHALLGRETPASDALPAAAGLADMEAESAFPTDQEHAPLRRYWKRNWPSISASVLLIALIGMQIAVRQRNELAAEHPDLRPALAMMCRVAGCELALPRTAERISIEGDEMIAADPQTPGRVTLLATLRNSAPFAVAYPSLELTLQNARDEVLARRVLGPADYLERGTDLAGGLASRSDVNLRLALETGPVRAEGYRVLVFYPGSP
ncbi:MAG: zinc-ribbon and DUF3426 domain-containing protein [Burkholderiales bacterium]